MKGIPFHQIGQTIIMERPLSRAVRLRTTQPSREQSPQQGAGLRRPHFVNGLLLENTGSDGPKRTPRLRSTHRGGLYAGLYMDNCLTRWGQDHQEP